MRTQETKVGIFIACTCIVFVCVGFYLGLFHINKNSHAHYKLCFDDASGLLKKADVKISGVPVGWVEQISLPNQQVPQAHIDICISKDHTLHQDAYGVIRQEGIIGQVYLEIDPGSPSLPALKDGAQLKKTELGPTSTEEIMQNVKDVAEQITATTHAIKSAFSGSAHVTPQTQESPYQKAPTGLGQEQLSLLHNISLASNSLAQGAQEMSTLLKKINDGHGLIGQIVNNDEVYNHVTSCTRVCADAFEWLSNIYVTYDGHFENMFERASFSCFKNSKGIFNARIYPSSDYFYLVGVTTSQQGYIRRTSTFLNFKDDCLNQICQAEQLPEWARYEYIYNKDKQRVKLNAFRANLQFGRRFKNIALRAGLFEGTGGFAVDFFVPYQNRYGLISTFKMYDFRGQNRINDERPHLKWINRIFLFNAVYIAFGFDDFVSKCNKSIFIGAGFRFGDTEIAKLLGID